MESVNIVIAGTSHDEDSEDLQNSVGFESITVEESELNDQEDLEEEETVELEEYPIHIQKVTFSIEFCLYVLFILPCIHLCIQLMIYRQQALISIDNILTCELYHS